MADAKITALTNLASPSLDDLLAVVDDPSGTPVTKKATLASVLALAVSSISVQVLSGSGTYSAPSGLRWVLAIVQGGGGPGNDANGTDAVSGGGGGGGCAIKLLTAAQLSGFGVYDVGAQSSANTNGNNSTLTWSGGTITGNGGNQSTESAASTTVGTAGDGGTGGSASGGDLNMPGGDGNAGVIFSTTLGQGGTGGNAFLGKGGRGGSDDEAGANGKNYGGGGGGGHAAGTTDRAGGLGAAGTIYMIEFKGGV